jgi:hypothetical protein
VNVKGVYTGIILGVCRRMCDRDAPRARGCLNMGVIICVYRSRCRRGAPVGRPDTRTPIMCVCR